MVREQMPLQASQKRISWSYEPVTRMTDMSARGAEDTGGLDWTGMAVGTLKCGGAGARAQALGLLTSAVGEEGAAALQGAAPA